jgi:hypothetical protein
MNCINCKLPIERVTPIGEDERWVHSDFKNTACALVAMPPQRQGLAERVFTMNDANYFAMLSTRLAEDGSDAETEELLKWVDSKLAMLHSGMTLLVQCVPMPPPVDVEVEAAKAGNEIADMLGEKEPYPGIKS